MSTFQDFEAELAAACEVKHAVAMVNGTAALEVALRVVGVDPGSEVLLPSLTFVATANAVSHLNAVPHFVDVEDRSLGIDSHALERHLKKIGRQTSGDFSIKRLVAAFQPSSRYMSLAILQPWMN